MLLTDTLGLLAPVKGDCNARANRHSTLLCTFNFMAWVWRRSTYGCDGRVWKLPVEEQETILWECEVIFVTLAKFGVCVCVLDFMTLLMMIRCLQMLYTFHTDTRSCTWPAGWECLTYEALAKKNIQLVDCSIHNAETSGQLGEEKREEKQWGSLRKVEASCEMKQQAKVAVQKER